MRAMFMVVASIILAAGLFGCNRQQQVAEQAPVTAVAPPPAAVPPPPPPPVPAAEPSHHYRHHASRRTHYASYESYGEDQSAPYSEDQGYSEGDDYSGDDYDVSTSQEGSGGAAEAHGEVWVDGYGREHYMAATPGDDPGALSREDERLRRKVWRGWNSDCDER